MPAVVTKGANRDPRELGVRVFHAYMQPTASDEASGTSSSRLLVATPASAEMIFFSEHRSMSVAGHRLEGDRIVVSLRGGGEMTFDRSIITKIAP